MIYSISYDLHDPGQDYTSLHEAIKSCGSWWHYLDSTWLVETNKTAQGIWNTIKGSLDDNDHILIIGVTKDYEGWLPQSAWDWINGRKAA